MEHSGFGITWVAIGSRSGPALPEEDCYRVWRMPYRNNDPRTALWLSRRLREIGADGFDLVYSDSLGLMYYTALLHCCGHAPVVHAAHNVMPYSVWPAILRAEVKYVFWRCRHFQMFSQHTARWFAAHYPAKSMFYAPMTVKDFGPVRTDNYDFDSSRVNLLFFGNIVANKRLDLLIDAVKGLPEDVRRRVRLNICGSCRMDEEAFQRQIGGCEAIRTWFCRIPDEEIPELFTKSQFLVLPYQDVAQSGPHMIAYNYNLPVIASDIDGFAERVEDGVDGFLFRSKDVDDLRDKIAKAVMMGEAGRKTMRENLAAFTAKNYAVPMVASRYVEYFNSILK